MKALAQGLVKGKIDEVLIQYFSLLFKFESETLSSLSKDPISNYTESSLAGCRQRLPHLGAAKSAGRNSSDHPHNFSFSNFTSNV